MADRGLPDRTVDPRFEQSQDAERNRGRLNLAQIFLTGLGAYAGIRYFSRPNLLKAAAALEREISRRPRLAKSRFIPQIYKRLGRRGLPGGQGQHVLFPGHNQREIADFFLADDFNEAARAAAGSNPLFGSIDVIINSLIATSDRLGPRPIAGFRRPMMADVIGEGPIQKLLSDHLGGSFNRLETGFNRFVNSPQARAAFQRREMTVGEFAKRITLGPGMFLRDQGAKTQLLNAARFTPRKLLEWVTGARIPFTKFRPLQMLYPTELGRAGPTIKRFGTELAIEGGAEDGHLGTFFAGGRMWSIKDGPLGGASLGQYRGDGFRLGRVSSQMARGAEARVYGELATRRNRQIPGGFDPVAESLKKLGLKKPNLNFFERQLEKAVKFGHQVGIGPTYSMSVQSGMGMPLGGYPGAFLKSLRRKATMTPGIPPEFIRGTLTAAEELPETQFFRKLLRLARPVENPQALKELTFFERLKLRLGAEPTRRVIVPGRGGGREATVPVARWVKPGEAVPAAVSELRRPSFSGGYYAYKGGTRGAADWLNYMVMRPSWLLEAGLGVGMRPGKTVAKNIAGWFSKVILPAYFGYEALKYAEFKSQKITGTGPLSLLGGLYAKARVGTQAVLDQLGVTEAAASAEDLLPGVESSPLSRVARFTAAAYGGAVLGKKTGKPGIGMAVGLIVGFFNLGDLTKTAGELSDIYSGEQLEPVRKGAGWVLGSTPFEGGDILYYKKHWLASMQDWTREKSIYGSPSQSWRNSWLPTPENAFLLKNLFDPYYTTRRNYWTRPYPATGPLFTEIPLVGPMLGGTIGRFLKPVHRMHPEAFTRGMANPLMPGAELESLRGAETLGLSNLPPYYPQRGLPVSGTTATDLVMPQVETPRGVLRYRMDALTSDALNELFEFSGLPGFLYQFGLENLTGSQYLSDSPRLADSNDIDSVSRAYYDQRLGGLLGYTELARRFITKDPRIPKINPIMNALPSWLPGSRSDKEEDRDYFLDFQRGDAYAKTMMGEARLPGPGYESLRRLHSGTPEVYDPIDRFLILSDVAPGSSSYKEYKTLATQWMNAGMLDPYWKKQVRKALRRVQEKFDSAPTEEYRFSSEPLRQQVFIDEVLGSTKFRANNQIFQLAGVARDLESLEIENRSFDRRSAIRQFEQTRGQLEGLVGREVEILTGAPGTAATPAIVGEINREAILSGLGTKSRDPLASRARFTGAQRLIGSLWEKVRHFDFPSPVPFLDPSAAYRKIFGRRSALEQYQAAELEGGRFSDWMSPVKSFIKPWAYKIYNTFRGEPYVPAEVRARRDLDLYFDRLQYLKLRRLAALANAKGESELVDSFNKRAAATMTGFGIRKDFSAVYQSIPRSERPYFKAFSRLTDPYDQNAVLGMLPEPVQNIYLAVWNRDQRKTQYDGPLIRHYTDKATRGSPTFEEADRIAAEFFQANRIPEDSWVGWHPSVDMEDIRIKTGTSEGMDVHAMGAWDSTVSRIESELPFIQPVIERNISVPMERQRRIFAELERMHHPAYAVNPSAVPGIQVTILRQSRYARRMNDFEAYSAGRGSLN